MSTPLMTALFWTGAFMLMICFILVKSFDEPPNWVLLVFYVMFWAGVAMWIIPIVNALINLWRAAL